MDLKICVYRNSKAILDNKPCFRETIVDVKPGFGYENLVLAMKSVFGEKSFIDFCLI